MAGGWGFPEKALAIFREAVCSEDEWADTVTVTVVRRCPDLLSVLGRIT